MKVWKFLLSILTICLGGQLQAQNDILFTHYNFISTYYNPATLGVGGQSKVSFLHRTQWAGYTGTFDQGLAPTTQLVSISIPFQKVLSGAGANVVTDRIGALTSFQVHLGGAIQKKLSSGILCVGITPIIISQSINTSFFRSVDADDPLIPTGGQQTETRANLNIGTHFTSPNNYFIGIATLNLLEPSFDFGTEAKNQIYSTTYLIHGGMEFELSRNLFLLPTALARTNLTSYSIDFTALGSYRETYFVGLGYRRSESALLQLGYSILENKRLLISYSLDYVIVDSQSKRPTSHEVFIRYNLPDLIIGRRKVVKTPRFTF